MPVIAKPARRPWQPVREAHGGRHRKNSEFYNSTEWRKLRALKVLHNPVCEECLRNKRVTPAAVVDHIMPINDGGARLDLANLQSLCHPCHNAKSGREAARR